jgi:dTDP-glucose 4,6-dehydratase
MDITKIRRELGWKPRHSLHEGLSATVEWFLSHPDWVDAIQCRTEYQTWLNRNYDERKGPA